MRGISEQVKIGIFIVIAVGLAYFGYNSVIKITKPSTYSVKVEFKDARGISKGTPVRRAGTDIGWVESVSLDSERGIAVADVRILSRATFPKDAIFYIVSEGLIEEKFLLIRDSPKPTPGLGYAEEGDIFQGELAPGFTDILRSANEALIQVNRILNVAGSFMSEEKLGGIVQELLSELNSTIGSARVVLERISSLLGSTQGDITDTVKNIQQATSDLSEVSREVKLAVQQTDLPNRVEALLMQIDASLSLINKIASDIAELTSDEQFKDDIKGVFHEGKEALTESKETLKTLRGTLEKVDKKLERFGGLGFEGKLNIRNESTHNKSRSDNAYIDVKTRVTVGENSLDLGVENLSEDTPEDAGMVLQVGKKAGDSILVRGGVYRDELGVGVDLFGGDSVSLSLDAFNLNNPALNSYLTLPFPRRFKLLLGVEDVGDRNQYNAGIQVHF